MVNRLKNEYFNCFRHVYRLNSNLILSHFLTKLALSIVVIHKKILRHLVIKIAQDSAVHNTIIVKYVLKSMS